MIGSLGEVLFFAVVLFLGCVGLAIVLATLVVPEWRANHAFVEHTCRIVERRIASRGSEDGPVFRPELRIQYTVDGRTYCTWTYDIRQAYASDEKAALAVLDEFVVEREYPCWYDPLDPGIAVLTRGYSGWVWLTIAVPVSFILISAGGLGYRLLTVGKSTERRALIAKRAARLAAFASVHRGATEYPHVPGVADVTNSPGTTLAYRLPPERLRAWSLGVWLAVSIVWNSLVAVFAVLVVRGFAAGEPDWFMTVFTIPFLICGIGLVVHFVRQVCAAAAVGPTLVEVSVQPLVPGKSCEVFLSQTGRLKLDSLELFLVCEEETTYRHGTNTRTESRRVFQQSFYRQEAFEVQRGSPFHVRCTVEVPAGVMHSFKATHNEVRWRLVVRGEPKGRAFYERTFPVIVLPKCSHNGKS